MSFITPPSLSELPPPPTGKRGWPWTEASTPFPELRADSTDWPSLRVVTPSYGQAEYIEETIRSVLLQGYPSLEYFVIDGGSKDGTVDIIEKYSPWLSGWVSEPDKGQVDAIKKGMLGAEEDYFTWLNSDDLFDANALSILAQAREGYAIAGTVSNFIEGNIVERKTNFGLDLATYTKRWSPSVFHQPGVFWPLRGSLLDALDETLHYAFDVKLLLKYLLESGVVDCTEHPVARFRLHDRSKTVSEAAFFLPERVRILEEFCNSFDDRGDHNVRKELESKFWSEFLQLKLSERAIAGVGEITRRLAENPARLNRETLGALRRLLKGLVSRNPAR